MSVINSMLRDLERRGADSENSNEILSGLSASQDNRAAADAGKSSVMYIAGTTSVIAILLILMAVYYLSPYKLVAEAAPAFLANSTSANKGVQTAVISHEVPSTNEISAEKINARVAPEAVTVTATHKISETQPSSVQLQVIKPVVRSLAESANTKVSNTAADTESQTAAAPYALADSKQSESDALDNEIDADGGLSVVSKQQRELTPEEKSKQAYANALQYYEQGDKQQAKTLLSQALNYNALNADSHKLLAMIYMENGRADIATEVIEKGLTVLASDQNLLRLYVRALVQTSNYKQAISVMEKRLNLTSPDDLGYLAGLYQKNNDHLNAVKLYAQALQLIPTRSVWWMGQGISLEVMQKYQEALQSYQQSIKTGQLSGKLSEYAFSRIKIIKQHNPDSVS